MATVVSSPERLVILDNVSWETYERLIDEHGERCGTRFTYDEGVLQIMVISSRHEEPNRTLALLVEVLAEEMDIDLRRLGSMNTIFILRRRPRCRGSGLPAICWWW